ncbi:MAG TPA: diguanylate cyclase [Allosphingosinicella sp.]|jgi:diguanylate cyclase (GGDEF)-like protein/PAS domain S-box-containing protein
MSAAVPNLVEHRRRKSVLDGESAAWFPALLEMQQAVIAARADLGAVMQAVTDGALLMIPVADGAVLEALDGEELVYRAASGTSSSAIGFRLPTSGSLSGLCIVEQRPLRCTDVRTDPRVNRPACERLGIMSMLLVPIFRNDDVVAVLKVHSARANAFGENDVLILQLLVGPISLGFANMLEAQAREARRRADRRFAATFEQAAVGIAHVDPGGAFIQVNDRFCEIAGRAREDVIGRGFEHITHRDDLAIDLEQVKGLLLDRIARYSMMKRYIRNDGGIVWVNLTVSLVRDEARRPEFFVAVIEDITARKDAELAATQDALTGLLNRRGMTERLGRELARLGGRDELLLLAYVDLDGFKAVNDQLGHAEGDRCLTAVARALGSACRPGDALCRIGGDEFLLVLPGLLPVDAPTILNRLCRAVEKAGAEGGWPVTGSIGALCVDGETAPSADRAIEMADQLMYRAKQGGKDRFVLSTGPAEAEA